VLAAMLAAGQPLSQMAKALTVLPQAVRNLKVEAKPPLEDCAAIIQAMGEVEDALGSRGRIVVRYSGTEPLARIMVEGESEEQIGQLADRMAAVMAEELGGVLV